MKYDFTLNGYNINNFNMSDVSSTDSSGSEKGPNATSSMERVKRLISPGTKRKLIGNNANKTYGVPLEDLIKRAPLGYRVPIVVKKLCDYIDKNGLDQEGIFRINGSARIVDKIRTSFDQTGDADLDEDCDVMAIAGALKLYLRELPDSTVPEHMTNQFIAIQEANQGDSESCIKLLKLAVKDLPLDNYNLLKFLCQFLVVVAHHESCNKMGSTSLGIVFGPNIFRCGQGLTGLKDQGIINQITTKFIMNYDNIFKMDHEDSPISLWEKRRQKVPPPRPPPPKLSVHIEDMRPVPSPRKIKDYESANYQDEWNDDFIPTINNIPASPRATYSDDEFTGRASPFGLDSEGYSMIESPVVTARTSRAVDRAISDTITGLIFGDDDFNVSPEKDTSSIGTESEIFSQAGHSYTEKDDCESHGPSIQIFDLINRFENSDDIDGEGDVTFASKSKQRPSSTAFDYFESKGVLIAQAQEPMSRSVTSSIGMFNTNEEFEVVATKSDNLLSGFKKPVGPVRRTPSRKGRRSMEREDEELEALLKETDIVSTKDNFSKKWSKKYEHNNDTHKLTSGQDDLARDEKENRPTPEHSPSNSRKPFIPPLDLTILHEHVDSSDPIPAIKAQSMSYIIPVEHNEWDKENEEEMDPCVILSPRSSKKKNGWLSGDHCDIEEAPMSPSAKCFPDEYSAALNTDIAPSPPVDQNFYRKHGPAPDDDISCKLRQLTKKIQVHKKKIKNFEESFERDHGYRPSQSEKSSKPEIKKNMSELSKARKDLKKLKEEAEMGSRSRHGSGASSSGERTDPPSSALSSIEKTLEMLQKRLEDKRIEAHRPHDIETMRRDQVQEEKLAIQKSLLHFENLHGRPTNKREKDLMRPLYDRYRSIKRMLAKPMSPRDTVELETVPEDQLIEISSKPSTSFHVKIPTAEEDDEECYDQLGTLDFAVTRDFNVLKDTIIPTDIKSSISSNVKKKQILSYTEWQSTESNLHELDIHELHDELHKTKTDKRKMRRQLREFEDDFFEENGRKVQKEDRTPLQEEYDQYKQIKARLRLLEALITKHNTSEA